MKYIILITTIFLFGCDLTGIEGKINRMTKPVYIAAAGSEGNVTLRDASGNVLIIGRTCYIAKSIKNSGFKNGDIFIPLPLI